MKNMNVRLSTLWVFAVFNYLYADIITLMDSAMLRQIMAGMIGSIQITEGFLLGGAILIETAIAMVLLSDGRAYPQRLSPTSLNGRRESTASGTARPLRGRTGRE
jgi:hypothetical protein